MTGETAELTVSFGSHKANQKEVKSWNQNYSDGPTVSRGMVSTTSDANDFKYIPCTTERLYEKGLDGLEFGVSLRYPGPRLNLTTQSIVDLNNSKMGATIVSQLWLGVLNPFSMDVIVQAIHIDTFWDLAPDPSVTLTQNYDYDKFMPLKPNDVTLVGTSNTTKSGQLVSCVDLRDNFKATSMMRSQLTYDSSDPDSGHMMMRSNGRYSLRIGLINVTFRYYQGNTATCDLAYVRATGSCLGCQPSANSIHNDGRADLSCEL